MRRSPLDGTVLELVPSADPKAVADTVARAREAQSGWADTPLHERIELLHRAADRLTDRATDLALLQRREMGQPVELGTQMITAAADSWRAQAELAWTYPFCRTLCEQLPGWTTRNLRQPLGVVAVISPWNFPVATAAGAVAPSLLAGNAVVLKPSEKAPCSVAELADILDVGDAFQVLIGDGSTGAELVTHPGVDLVLHTGSVRTGREIASVVGARGGRVGLELGGKDPVVVDRDVDPVWAAQLVAHGTMLNSGQVCTSMERVYVHRDIADAFLDHLVDRVQELTLGPLVDSAQRDSVHAHVLDACSRGATTLTGGRIPEGPGFFYPATVMVNVDDDALVMTQETFGPVAPVQVVESFEEGLRKAALTDYGLSATLLTGSPEHAALADQLPAAVVWVNTWQTGAEGMQLEPTRSSGMRAVGGRADFDLVTRAMAVHALSPTWES